MLSLLVICIFQAPAWATARGCDCVYDNDLGEVSKQKAHAYRVFHIKCPKDPAYLFIYIHCIFGSDRSSRRDNLESIHLEGENWMNLAL